MGPLFQYYSHLQKYLIYSYHFHHRVYIIIANSQLPALQLAWLAQWIERCVRASQRSGFDYRARLDFVHFLSIFFFFINRPACLFNCEDNFLFHTLYLILAFKNGLSIILCLWSSFLPSQICHQYKTMKTWRNNFEWKGERGWVLHLTEVQIAAIWSKKDHFSSECLNIYATDRSWLLLLLMQPVKLVQ